MNSDKKHIIVGLFVLGGLMLCALLIIWFQGIAIALRGGYIIKGHLPATAGSRAGKRVHMDGIEIGEVRDVVTSLPGRPGVWVVMKVEPEARIPEKAQFVAQSQLAGDSILDFQTTEASKGYLPTDGTAVVEGAIRAPNFFPTDTIERFDGLMTDLAGLKPLIANLTELTAPRTLKDVAAGKPKNLATALEQFQDSARSVRAFVEDPETKKLFASASKAAEDLSKTLEDARKTLAAVKTTAETYTEAGKKADALVVKGAEMVAKFTKDAEDAQKMIENLNGLVTDVRAGKGTLGQLIASDELHRELTDLVENLTTMTDNANRLLIMLRREGLGAKEGK